MPWSFPHHWQVVLPLTLLYAVAIYRHALIANQFFRQQVQLEDDGIRLAESYRLAKEEAEDALRAKNLFLTTASHDLRQPVHAMGFLIEAIAQRNRDPALNPPLEDLRRSVRSVHLMFNSLLDLSKIEQGMAMPRSAPVALAPIMEEVAALFREEAHSRHLDLRVRVPKQAAAVLADAALLRQSLVNLVHNALRYTQRGGVLLSARRREADWLLEVWDTGIGVANEDKSRIYSPYYRNEYAWRIDSAGHGLGLAVVARCATMMGAAYGLDSVERRGSRFWLRFPAADPGQAHVHAMAAESQARPTSALPPLSGCCLIVEDDPVVVRAWGEPDAGMARRCTLRGLGDGSDRAAPCRPASAGDPVRPAPAIRRERLRGAEGAAGALSRRQRRNGQRRIRFARPAAGRTRGLCGAAQAGGAGAAACIAVPVASAGRDAAPRVVIRGR
ncbi:sensor histidine kinase [Cupriavidus sp. H18C1]|uniref:sensor histidine kinase n=1 Tax=Cupriavidus sp. H18C1 TaxID=3241601 RepID=UPI003BB87DEC